MLVLNAAQVPLAFKAFFSACLVVLKKTELNICFNDHGVHSFVRKKGGLLASVPTGIASNLVLIIRQTVNVEMLLLLCYFVVIYMII